MRYVIPVLLTLMTVNIGQAQVEIRFNPGYGSYQMKILKDLQEKVSQSMMDLPLNITASYPAYYNYQAQVVIHTRQGNFGPVLGMATTGSRISYQDYSGVLLRDEYLKGHQVGLFYEALAVKKYDIMVMLSLQALINFTNYKSKVNIDLTESPDPVVEILEGNSIGYGVQPLLLLRYELRPFTFGVQGGYHYEKSGVFYADKNKEQPIQNIFTQEKLRPSWNGWRAGLTLGLLIGQQNREDVNEP